MVCKYVFSYIFQEYMVNLQCFNTILQDFMMLYRGADKSLARPGRKQAIATEDSDVHISYLLS